MKKILFAIVMASVALLPIGCDSSQTKDAGKNDADSTASIMTDDDLEYTELVKVPLPCTKEELSAAWKQISCGNEAHKGKALNYKEHTPIFFISTDLDGDDKAEVLMRGESPYAAIYSYVKDSLYLITFVDHAQIGLGITPGGVIVRSGSNRSGSFSQFIKLENSLPATKGECRETFSIQGNEMVSADIQYFLETDSAMVKVSKEKYQNVAPHQDATFFEDIDGWEDFRKP